MTVEGHVCPAGEDGVWEWGVCAATRYGGTLGGGADLEEGQTFMEHAARDRIDRMPP